MNFENRIKKIERKHHRPKTVVYDGRKPDIQKPGVTFLRMDGIFDGRDEYFITDKSHEESLEELD